MGVGATSLVTLLGCRASDYRHEADRSSYSIIAEKQVEALGKSEAFTIETPADALRRRLLLDQGLPFTENSSLGVQDIKPIDQWPDDEYLKKPTEQQEPGVATEEVLTLTLTDALQVAAHESREYQSQKEQVFQVALRLDLERDAFRRTWTGVLTGLYQAQLEQTVALDDEGHTDRQTVGGLEYGGVLGMSQRLRNGLSFSGQIGLDLVSLLTQERLFSRGVFADVTVTVPLMRGSGEFVVTEPLKQAERDVVYALYSFERYKRSFAVDVATEYLAVLRQADSVTNARDNYERLIRSTRRARRLAKAGRLPEIQVDQSRQDELRARNQWVSARASYRRQLDSFKLRLGLPPDASIELDHAELRRVKDAMEPMIAMASSDLAALQAAASQPADEEAAAFEQEFPSAKAPVEIEEPGRGTPGPYELDERGAIVSALQNRLDLRVAVGRVHDAQREVAVAADQLRADVTLLGRGSAGAQRSLSSAGAADSILRPDEGQYSALLTVDLPFERTSERNMYRNSLIGLEQAVRDVQALEDQIKLDVRNDLSRLLEAREGIQIQAAAAIVAERRVTSTNLFLEAGRAEIRDSLEAQDALVTAQNALTAALVNYRVGELNLQRDLDVLEVNETGLWREYQPENGTD